MNIPKCSLEILEIKCFVNSAGLWSNATSVFKLSNIAKLQSINEKCLRQTKEHQKRNFSYQQIGKTTLNVVKAFFEADIPRY